MSDTVKINLAKWSAIALIIGSLGAAALYCAAIPYRIEAAEKRIDVLEQRSQKDSELLTRIDERTEQIQKQLEKSKQ